jgi:hypothetical protein
MQTKKSRVAGLRGCSSFFAVGVRVASGGVASGAGGGGVVRRLAAGGGLGVRGAWGRERWVRRVRPLRCLHALPESQVLIGALVEAGRVVRCCGVAGYFYAQRGLA